MRILVRNDDQGKGHFGARRKGGTKFHDGVDLVVDPGEYITLPYAGVVEKYEIPYAADRRWEGIQVRLIGMDVRVEIWYMEPRPFVTLDEFLPGDILGIAQDISLKYPGMTPHVHVRASLLPNSYLVKQQWGQSVVYVDPLKILTRL